MKKHITTSLALAASLALVAAPALADTAPMTTAAPTTTTAPAPMLIATNTLFTRNIAQGAVGDDVRQLQVFLNKTPATAVAVAPHPGSAGHETTGFGPATTAAVKSFQKLNGIEATGIVGPLTRAALNTLVTAAPAAPVVRSFTADTSTHGTAILTVSYDGGLEAPTVWYAYGAMPSSMSILSSKVVSQKIVGSSQVTLSNLGDGDCWAQVSVQNSLGTTVSAPVHCAK